MKSNNLFSLRRFMLLFKQSFMVNKKLIGISLAGLTGIIFISLVLFQSVSKFQIWNPGRSMATFQLFFFSLGIVYSSLSFPSFRSKEKTMFYLMLPASNFEKFIFEFLTRIIAFILFMPFIFWMTANIEGAIVHRFIPESIGFYYRFPFETFLKTFNHKDTLEGWHKFSNIQTGLFVFVAAFAGASYFSKSPLMKTIFMFLIIFGGFSLFTYLLYKGLNLNENNLSIERIPFIKSRDQGAVFTALLITTVNLALLSIAWFSLKEKEA